jgi:RNA polymerase sigma-70 factor (ECF subfamily)
MTEPKDHSSSDIATQFSLIQQAKANEPVAWELVFSLYAPLIKRWARGYGVDCPFEADNVCQEVFTKLVKNIASFEHRENGGSFRGWLRVITRNYIWTQQMGKVNPQTIGGTLWNLQLNQIPYNTSSGRSLLDAPDDGDDDTRELIFLRIMKWVEANYSESQSIAFKRVVIDHRPAREVAEELDLTTNIVYQNKSRILAKIRSVFQELV